MDTYAIVTPVYEDAESFAELCRRVGAAGRAAGVRFYLIAVDDGSLRDPPQLSHLNEAGVDGEILRLARNVGHQMAISIGLARASEMAGLSGCVIMDCDGEDRPEALPALLAALKREDVDVAAAERAQRTESVLFQVFYFVYRRFFALLSGQRLRFGNFMALKPMGLERLSGMHETGIHVAAATVRARLRRTDVPIDRGVRFAGASKMNFPSLVLHGMRALMVFADLVLTRMALALVALASTVVIVLGGAGVAKLAGYASPGWFTNVTGFALLIFLQAGLFAMITLIVSSLGRVETPPRVRARALEFVARIERAENSSVRSVGG